LIQDKELYDLASDFSQQTNVIDKHPTVVARMRADYERWWDRVAPGVNEFSALVIGADAENPSLLSPADWQDSFLDQGRQVREGLRRNGTWNVVVERAGDYEFELRRWPREAAAALAGGLPAQRHTDGEFPPGVALPIAQARVRVGGCDERRAVAPDDQSVTFTATLPAGRTQLQTWFYDAEGRELCGAYYVYVTRK
jgi:hypothetical protein